MFGFFDLINGIIKYAMILLVTLLVFCAYNYIIKPLYLRHKYSKFSNVVMSEHFHPLGDHPLVKENLKKKRFPFYFYIQASLENPNYDIRIAFSGPTPLFVL